MAGLTDSLRGDGLSRVHRALDGLEADPLGLDRARMRFSQPPPSYTSNPSGTTTRSASPEPPRDEQRRREQREQRFQRRRKLIDERAASLPLEQFKAQRNEERERIWNADPRTNWMSKSKIPIGGTEEKEAIETVKKRWVEQGIWKDEWDEMAAGRYMNIGRWQHEEPLELESESETDTKAESPPPTFSIFGVPQKHLQPKPRRPKSTDEKQRVTERRAVWERKREASCPYHQFFYQISKERERIQEESENRGGAHATDINTRAYENVKNTWTKRGIWSGRWGILPGMSWKQKEPLEEEAPEGPTPVQANPLVNGSHEAGEAPAIRNFGSPSPIKSQQGPPADIDSAGSENGNTKRKRKAFHKDGQPANASLSPVHSSKVSKAAGKRKGPQRRLNISQKASSDSLPLSFGVAAAEPQPPLSPDRIAPRRSKRIQPPVPTVSEDPTRRASTNPPKRAVRSKPERNVASSLTARSAVKPQGISKTPPEKSTRGRPRRK